VIATGNIELALLDLQFVEALKEHSFSMVTPTATATPEGLGDSIMRDDLPPELTEFVAVLDAQPGPVQAIFQYCLAMLMVEAGKARLTETQPSEAGTMCTFETVAGDVFTLLKPQLSEADEAAIRAELREILGKDG
jgi:hypothetical protein